MASPQPTDSVWSFTPSGVTTVCTSVSCIATGPQFGARIVSAGFWVKKLCGMR